jgi:hypothetical protein
MRKEYLVIVNHKSQSIWMGNTTAYRDLGHDYVQSSVKLYEGPDRDEANRLAMRLQLEYSLYDLECRFAPDKVSRQQVAKWLYGIDWRAFHDSPDAQAREDLKVIEDYLLGQMTQSEAVELLLAVIEAKDLVKQSCDEINFARLADFNKLI